MKRIWNLPIVEYLPFREVHETAEVAVVYTQPAWDIVKDLLSLNQVWEGQIYGADEQHWEMLLADFKGETVYAVGGGLAVDAAKFMAAKNDLPLVCLPTAMTVDAFFYGGLGNPPQWLCYLYRNQTTQQDHYRSTCHSASTTGIARIGHL